MGDERVSDTVLLAELHRLSESLEKTPSQRDMNDDGKFSHMAYVRRFGGWNQAIEEAGLETNHGRGTKTISDAELVAELDRLAEDLGRSPSMRDMDDHGKFLAQTYQDRFGWNNAKRELGLETHDVDGSRPVVAYLLSNGPSEKADLPESEVAVADKFAGVTSFRVSSTESSPEANGGRVTPVYYLHADHSKHAVVEAFLDANPALIDSKSRHGLLQTMESAGSEWVAAASDVLDAPLVSQ